MVFKMSEWVESYVTYFCMFWNFCFWQFLAQFERDAWFSCLLQIDREEASTIDFIGAKKDAALLHNVNTFRKMEKNVTLCVFFRST